MRRTVKKDSLAVSSPDMGSDSHRGPTLRMGTKSLLPCNERRCNKKTFTVCQILRKGRIFESQEAFFCFPVTDLCAVCSSHLAVRSGLGSVVAAVSGLWTNSWRKAEWRSGCRRCWNLGGPTRNSKSQHLADKDIWRGFPSLYTTETRQSLLVNTYSYNKYSRLHKGVHFTAECARFKICSK